MHTVVSTDYRGKTIEHIEVSLIMQGYHGMQRNTMTYTVSIIEHAGSIFDRYGFQMAF